MYLYLIQHGEAKSEKEDLARPLSEKGVKDVRKGASFISSNTGIAVESIFHSGKLRAAQTAGIVEEYFKPGKGVSERDELAPMDDPAVWAKRLETEGTDLVLVGHLPHLARLASLLLCGNPDAGAVNFHMGGIVCLKREEGRWSVDWMIIPEMIKD
jgi:phosphohistidine phosphatase